MMPADQEPRYGCVHFNSGWFPRLVASMFLAVFLASVLGGIEAPTIMKVIWGILAALMTAMHWKPILRIPAVETDEQGIVLRNWYGWGRVFVRWEDVEGVVIWHDHTGGNRSTMIAVSAGEDFEYDNYGEHPRIRPARDRYRASKVKRHLRRWSVNTGTTSPRKIAALVNASRKGVTVVEELPFGGFRYRSGPP